MTLEGYRGLLLFYAARIVYLRAQLREAEDHFASVVSRVCGSEAG